MEDAKESSVVTSTPCPSTNDMGRLAFDVHAALMQSPHVGRKGMEGGS